MGSLPFGIAVEIEMVLEVAGGESRARSAGRAAKAGRAAPRAARRRR
jgi:hypothetical protein